ncbi:hypothetical protein ABJB81_006069 [Pseudomonas putida]|uniref:hypothetical protein n=1 Tax=Pseudomonas asiatica TaxID=2219225 RepID=UPI001374DE3E|nr:hypothetical protein [Pseudomonas asiatica]
MIDLDTDFTGFPELPSYHADWAAVYMEPIVQSGERLTIGVVATNGSEHGAQLAISDAAMECLYGDSAQGMRSMMELALQRALEFARTGFAGSFSSGIHGVSISKRREGLGEDLDDVILQGISLTSSLCDLHADDASANGYDRTSYWQRMRGAMERVNPALAKNFGRPVPVSIKGSTINLQCDYFSSTQAVNICGMLPGARQSNLFDIASARVARLDQIKRHDSLIGHDQSASLLIVTPSDLQVANLKPASRKSFSDKILLLQDMVDDLGYKLIRVSSPREGALRLQELENSAA